MQPEGLVQEAPERAASVIRKQAGLERLFRRVFSFPAVLLAGLVFLTVFTVANRFNDPDLWWNLKIGQVIATTHAIPTTDQFSFTAQGKPWTAHEWLAQVSIYGAYAAGGPQGLMVWLCVLASLLLAVVYALCRMNSGDELVSFLGATLAWLFATIGLAIRALMLGYLFLAVELLLLELARTKDRRWLWCLPPIFAVWANCHGSYVFGIAVLAVYWICSWVSGKWGVISSREGWDNKGRNTLGVVLLLCVGALCCNPVGINLLIYPVDALFRLFHPADSVNAVVEWMPPDLRSARGIALLATVAAIVLSGLLRHTELNLRELLLVFTAFGMAIQHQRMLFVFGIVASPVVCRLLAPSSRRRTRQEHPIVNGALVLACLAGTVWAFPSTASLQEQVRKKSPVAAVDYIRRQKLSGPMLNEYVFGGYLMWAMPEHKVFIDGRADVYDWAGVFSQYSRWAGLVDDPKVMLDKYQVRFCLLQRGVPLTRVIPYLPGWHKAYSDDVAEVFVR